jgi:DNA-directed RNA polymerase subunit RPC12/RpoP
VRYTARLQGRPASAASHLQGLTYPLYVSWGGRQMGAGRRVACPHCGDPLMLQPTELDALEQGDVRCPRCRRALIAW